VEILKEKYDYDENDKMWKKMITVDLKVLL